MKTKQTIAVIISLLLTLQAYSQSESNKSEYRKFYVSLNAGFDFPQGKSNTVFYTPFSEDLTLPLTKRGFAPGLDAAWFFSKNYGVGVKYRYYSVNYNMSGSFKNVEQGYYYYVFESRQTSFKERTHVLGPAFFAKWSLGTSKWELSTNVGIMYLYDKLSNIKGKVARYSNVPIDPALGWGSPNYYSEFTSEDLSGNTIGFAFSAGIRYQIIPFIGVGINANGLFGSLSEMKYKNNFTGVEESASISRKMSRIGISAAVDFSF